MQRPTKRSVDPSNIRSWTLCLLDWLRHLSYQPSFFKAPKSDSVMEERLIASLERAVQFCSCSEAGVHPFEGWLAARECCFRTRCLKTISGTITRMAVTEGHVLCCLIEPLAVSDAEVTWAACTGELLPLVTSLRNYRRRSIPSGLLPASWLTW